MHRVVLWQKPHESYRDSAFAANIVRRGARDAAGASPAAAPTH
jgi:hypothetical protein